MLTVCVQQYSFSTHKRMMFLWKCQSFWDKKCLDLRGTRKNRRHFTDDIFKSSFVNENISILNKISLKYVRKSPNDNNTVLVQIMAWCRTCFTFVISSIAGSSTVRSCGLGTTTSRSTGRDTETTTRGKLLNKCFAFSTINRTILSLGHPVVGKCPLHILASHDWFLPLLAAATRQQYKICIMYFPHSLSQCFVEYCAEQFVKILWY